MKPDTNNREDFYCIRKMHSVKDSQYGGRFALIDLVNMNNLQIQDTYLYESMSNTEEWDPVLELETQGQSAILTNLRLKKSRGEIKSRVRGKPLLNADGVKIHLVVTRAEIDQWLQEKNLL